MPTRGQYGTRLPWIAFVAIVTTSATCWLLLATHTDGDVRAAPSRILPEPGASGEQIPLFAGILTTNAVAETILWVSPVTTTASLPGAIVTVSVAISNVSSLGDFRFSLRLDPAVVSVTSVLLASFPTSASRAYSPLTVIANHGLYVVIAESSGPQPGASGSGDLVRLTVQPVDSGATALVLGDLRVLDTLREPMSVSVQNGFVSVGSSTASPSPTRTPSATTTETATPTRTTTPSATRTGTNTRTPTGTATDTAIPSVTSTGAATRSPTGTATPSPTGANTFTRTATRTGTATRTNTPAHAVLLPIIVSTFPMSEWWPLDSAAGINVSGMSVAQPVACTDVYAASPAGLLTGDWVTGFSSLPGPGPSPHRIAASRNYVYVTSWGLGVYRKPRSAGNWEAINSGLESTYVNALAVSSDGQTLYAATEFAGVFARKETDNRWWPVSGSNVGPINRLYSPPDQPEVVYAGSLQRVYKITGSGAGWQEVGNALNQTVWAILTNGEVVYAGVDHGVWKLPPGQGAWQEVGRLQSRGYSLALGWGSGDLYAGTNGQGIWRYTDANAEWRQVADTMLKQRRVPVLVGDGDLCRALYAGTDSGIWAANGPADAEGN